ncbi:MAG: hypothetical protein NVS4B2_31590 [Chloroflexota bacterium]
MATRGRARLCGTLLILAALFAPTFARAEGYHRARVVQHTVLKAQGIGPDQVHATRAFTVPRAWQVHWLFSCIDKPGRPSIFSIILLNPRNVHKELRRLTTTIASQGRGSAREHGAGTFRLRIVSPCVWNLQVTR